MRNLDGFTLAGFIKRAKTILREEHPELPNDIWHERWSGICEDHWNVELIPQQAVDAILITEGFE